mgnify:CR=1 FL=1
MAFNTYPCNPWPISTEQLNKGNNDDLNTRVAALEGEVSDLSDTKANQITIAPFFDPETAYEVGELVYYNGLSYRCTNDHEGDWDADDFASTTIAGELDTLKSGLSELSDTSSYSVADYYITKVGKMCILTINGATDSFNVPAAYIPNVTYRGSVEDANGDFVGRVVINNAGLVVFTPVSSTPKYGSITYFV